MVIVDYYYHNTCTSSTTASSCSEPMNTTMTVCTCSRCIQLLTHSTATTYTRTDNTDVEEEEKIEIEKPKWPLNLKIKPNVDILDNKPLVRHRRMLFSKSGWLLSKGKLKRRGY